VLLKQQQEALTAALEGMGESSGLDDGDDSNG